jgi:hypothetical protein
MTLRKEVNVEKKGYEGKNRAEVGIQEKMCKGGVQDKEGVQNNGFYGSTHPRQMPDTGGNSSSARLPAALRKAFISRKGLILCKILIPFVFREKKYGNLEIWLTT